MNADQIFSGRRAQPERFEDDASATVELIRTYLPSFEPRLKLNQQHGGWRFELPCPASAEYQFSLRGELGGERQISARHTRSKESNLRNRFWYSALEMAGFRDDASELERVFNERVKALMLCPTRIVEIKGIMWLSYKGGYQKGAEWKSLGGVSYLGLGFGIPFVDKKRVYTSPPVASCAQV